MDTPIVDTDGLKITPRVVSMLTPGGEMIWSISSIQKVAVRPKFGALEIALPALFLVVGVMAHIVFGLKDASYWLWGTALICYLPVAVFIYDRYRLQKIEITSAGRRDTVLVSRNAEFVDLVRRALERAIERHGNLGQTKAPAPS